MGLRILVVDDHLDSTESLAALLEIFHYEVRVARDGFTAIKIAREFNPSVGILDIGMPGMDGYELAEKLRAIRQQSIALIAVTGHGLEVDLENALNAGFDMHFLKPVDFCSLRNVLAQLEASPGAKNNRSHFQPTKWPVDPEMMPQALRRAP